jgi:cytochrome c-type biogenesis protein
LRKLLYYEAVAKEVGEHRRFMSLSLFSVGIAFLAGLASFLSPCVLPLVPIYLAQLVGQSVYQAPNNRATLAHNSDAGSTRLTTFAHAAVFVLGFTVAFVALGASASTLGSILLQHFAFLRQAGGVLLVIIGLYLTGLLKVPFLYQQRRFTFLPSRPGYLASLLIGIIFAIAWSPCVGPILSSILVLAASTATLQKGVLLLLVYSFGLGIPFLLLGLGLNQFSQVLRWLKPHLNKIEIITGVLMVVLGIVIFFNMLIFLNHFFNPIITI